MFADNYGKIMRYQIIIKQGDVLMEDCRIVIVIKA